MRCAFLGNAREGALINNGNHISNHFARLILKWKESNPNAIRGIKKASDEAGGFLLMDSEQKQKALEHYKMKNFRLSSGEKLDLTKFKEHASSQRGDFVKPKPLFM